MLQALRLCVAFFDCSRLDHFSKVDVAKNSVFEPSGCHLLWNILVMAENFAATIYVAFKAGKSEK